MQQNLFLMDSVMKPERVQAAFSFGPCTARFLFGKTEKKMGGALGQAGNPAGFPVQWGGLPPAPGRGE